MSRVNPYAGTEIFLQGFTRGGTAEEARLRRLQDESQFTRGNLLDRERLDFTRGQDATRNTQWDLNFARDLANDATRNEQWGQSYNLNRMQEDRMQAQEQAAQADGETLRQINRTLVGGPQNPSMLVPGQEGEPDPLAPLVENGPWQAQATLHKYLKNESQKRKARAVINEVKAGRLGPKMLADKELQALAEMAIEMDDPSTALRMVAQGQAAQARGAQDLPDDAMVQYYLSSLRNQYPQANPAVLLGTAQMLAANKPVDRPEIAVGQTGRVDTNTIKALETEVEIAKEEVRSAERELENARLSERTAAAAKVESARNRMAAMQRQLAQVYRGASSAGATATGAAPAAPGGVPLSDQQGAAAIRMFTTQNGRPPTREEFRSLMTGAQ